MRAFIWLPILLLVACAGAGPRAESQPATTTAVTTVEHGRALFRNKGCVTCHLNNRVEGETGTFRMGPDLTHYTRDADFLRRWLANPSAVKPGTEMPNLDLSAAEIEDLIAFLNEPR